MGGYDTMLGSCCDDGKLVERKALRMEKSLRLATSLMSSVVQEFCILVADADEVVSGSQFLNV
jgi:hypothetical protein